MGLFSSCLDLSETVRNFDADSRTNCSRETYFFSLTCCRTASRSWNSAVAGTDLTEVWSRMVPKHFQALLGPPLPPPTKKNRTFNLCPTFGKNTDLHASTSCNRMLNRDNKVLNRYILSLTWQTLHRLGLSKINGLDSLNFRKFANTTNTTQALQRNRIRKKKWKQKQRISLRNLLPSTMAFIFFCLSPSSTSKKTNPVCRNLNDLWPLQIVFTNQLLEDRYRPLAYLSTVALLCQFG